VSLEWYASLACSLARVDVKVFRLFVFDHHPSQLPIGFGFRLPGVIVLYIEAAFLQEGCQQLLLVAGEIGQHPFLYQLRCLLVRVIVPKVSPIGAQHLWQDNLNNNHNV